MEGGPAMGCSFEASFSNVCAAVQRACEKAGRSTDSVNLLAVSKTVTVDAIEVLHRLGHRTFAESRIQEAKPKIDLLPDSIQWHFIGNIQKNKIRKIVKAFPLIHSVSSREQMLQISRISVEEGCSPELFLQVNVAGEDTKGGFPPEDLGNQIDEIVSLPQVTCVGLMCIPPITGDPESSRGHFRALRVLRGELESSHGIKLPYLSMGMSGDFEVAIEEGATHVRVGSAIFGSREYPGSPEL